MRYVKKLLKKFLLGSDLIDSYLRGVAHLSSIKKVMDLYQAEIVFDVGANAGMSADSYRGLGFSGMIVSFEPVSHLYSKLYEKSRKDGLWEVENIALGCESGSVDILVSGGHGGASSILRMNEVLISKAPNQKVVRREKVLVGTLDQMFDKYYPVGDKAFVKLDVQGYEKEVLKGCRRCIDRIVAIKVEMAVIEMYENENLMMDMVSYLDGLGFKLVSLDHGWSDADNKQLFAVDGVFVRGSELK